MIKGFCSLIFLLVLAVIVGGGYLLWNGFIASPDKDAQEISFRIEPGESIGSITQRLKEEGVIDTDLAFKAFLKVFNKDAEIQAGSFVLKQGMNFSSLAKNLSQAFSNEVQVRIIEGMTRKEIGEKIREVLPEISEEQWELATGSESPFFQTHSFLSSVQAGQSLEGYLFPDTYRFNKTTDAVTITRKILDNFETRLEEVGAPVNTDLHKLITMASIVQKEAGSGSEMGNIVDIFRKRIEIGMPLQADSTVNYATGQNRRSATYTDLEFDSPYNTYKYRGLPPGPISNPGLSAIKAAVNPTPNPYYFFLHTPEGEILYGRTGEEHNANRAFLR